jgi:hypothetical protein
MLSLKSYDLEHLQVVVVGHLRRRYLGGALGLAMQSCDTVEDDPAVSADRVKPVDSN